MLRRRIEGAGVLSTAAGLNVTKYLHHSLSNPSAAARRNIDSEFRACGDISSTPRSRQRKALKAGKRVCRFDVARLLNALELRDESRLRHT